MKMEQGKKAAIEFLEATFERNADRVAATLTDDMEYTIGGKHARFAGVRTKQMWCSYMRTPTPFTKDGLKLIVHSIIAEGDRVAVECESYGVLSGSGKVYNNTYTFQFIIRDGKIARIREYMDTEHVNDVLPLPPKH
jgi:ketosteroid isomerase-like protein